MLLSDGEIRGLCMPRKHPAYSGDWYGLETVERNHWLGSRMIEPFSEAVSGDGVISYGLTSAGYDLRLGPVLLHFPGRCERVCSSCQLRGSCDKVADPKRFKDPAYQERFFRREEKTGQGSEIWIPPHQYVLGHSLEYLRIPKFLKARCVGKSTNARVGLFINTTPLEPEWEGHLTVEIGNITECPAVVYVGEGIAQLEFELLSAIPEVTYAGKQGQYQGQKGVTPARVK